MYPMGIKRLINDRIVAFGNSKSSNNFPAIRKSKTFIGARNSLLFFLKTLFHDVS
jgi:hypothetical protein